MRKRHTPPWSTYLIGRPPLPVHARARARDRAGRRERKSAPYAVSLFPFAVECAGELQESRGNAAAIAAAAAAVSDGFEQGRKGIDTFRLEGTGRAGLSPEILTGGKKGTRCLTEKPEGKMTGHR